MREHIPTLARFGKYAVRGWRQHASMSLEYFAVVGLAWTTMIADHALLGFTVRSASANFARVYRATGGLLTAGMTSVLCCLAGLLLSRMFHSRRPVSWAGLLAVLFLLFKLAPILGWRIYPDRLRLWWLAIVLVPASFCALGFAVGNRVFYGKLPSIQSGDVNSTRKQNA